jgi:cytochrome c556
MEKFEGYYDFENHPDFLSEYHLFVEHLGRLREVIAGRNTALLDSAVQEVQKSCIRCHEMFR